MVRSSVSVDSARLSHLLYLPPPLLRTQQPHLLHHLYCPLDSHQLKPHIPDLVLVKHQKHQYAIPWSHTNASCKGGNHSYMAAYSLVTPSSICDYLHHPLALQEGQTKGASAARVVICDEQEKKEGRQRKLRGQAKERRLSPLNSNSQDQCALPG